MASPRDESDDEIDGRCEGDRSEGVRQQAVPQHHRADRSAAIASAPASRPCLASSSRGVSVVNAIPLMMKRPSEGSNGEHFGTAPTAHCDETETARTGRSTGMGGLA
jgi:hypothetical protein